MYRVNVLFFTIIISISLFSCSSNNLDPNKVYSVVFGITIDESGQLKNLNVNKVFDPKSGSTANVNIEVSEVYISKIRELIIDKNYDAKFKDGVPIEFYTYFYYKPSMPTNTNILPF